MAFQIDNGIGATAVIDKEISGNDGVQLGFASSAHMFEKLKHDGMRLTGSWHPYAAFDFVVTAWHLFEDWKGAPDDTNLSQTKRNRSNLPAEMVLVIEVLRDIANSSKHRRLKDKDALKRRVTAVHSGTIGGFFEYAFQEDMPAVTVNTSYFSVRTLRNVTLRYFEWVFDESIPAKQFPGEIVETVRYCDIANRPVGIDSPALWLIDIESAYSTDDAEPTEAA